MVRWWLSTRGLHYYDKKKILHGRTVMVGQVFKAATGMVEPFDYCETYKKLADHKN